MNGQIALTVAEGKRLIARAVAAMPEVQAALKGGRILLKGGTTVSAVAEILAGTALRISGRISPRGTMAGAPDAEGPHSIVLEGGAWRNIDATFAEEAARLGPGDVVIVGANCFDAAGRAAMMAGSEGCGRPGAGLSALWCEGATVLIPAGLEKLIPGSVDDAIRAAGRKKAARSLGMAVGLVPLVGRVITELDAARMLARVEAAVIGRGGIAGGEGSTVLALEGEAAEVEKLFALVAALKGAAESGLGPSLVECRPGGPRCREHRACEYKRRKEPRK
jgi:hypothetical protein